MYAIGKSRGNNQNSERIVDPAHKIAVTYLGTERAKESIFKNGDRGRKRYMMAVGILAHACEPASQTFALSEEPAEVMQTESPLRDSLEKYWTMDIETHKRKGFVAVYHVTPSQLKAMQADSIPKQSKVRRGQR